jgi:glucose dehydrogenase
MPAFGWCWLAVVNSGFLCLAIGSSPYFWLVVLVLVSSILFVLIMARLGWFWMLVMAGLNSFDCL